MSLPTNRLLEKIYDVAVGYGNQCKPDATVKDHLIDIRTAWEDFQVGVKNSSNVDLAVIPGIKTIAMMMCLINKFGDLSTNANSKFLSDINFHVKIEGKKPRRKKRRVRKT